MTTVTGFVETAAGVALNTTVLVYPQSPVFPYVGAGGKIVTAQPITVQADPVSGAWSIGLEPGTYTFKTISPATLFPDINVPNDGGTYTLQQLGGFVTPATVPQAQAQTPGSPLNNVAGIGWTFDTVGLGFWYNPTGDPADWFKAFDFNP